MYINALSQIYFTRKRSTGAVVFNLIYFFKKLIFSTFMTLILVVHFETQFDRASPLLDIKNIEPDCSLQKPFEFTVFGLWNQD